MGIIIKSTPIEANHSIEIIERYHRPVRQVYSIITTKIPGIKPDLAL